MTSAQPTAAPRVRTRTRAAALLAVLVTCAAAAAAAPPTASAAASSSGTSAGSASGRSPRGVLGSLPAPAPGTVLRGTVERLAVEGDDLLRHSARTAHVDGPSGHAPAVLTFLRTPRGRVQVRGTDLARVRSGSVVEARTGAVRTTRSSAPAALASSGARLSGVRVLAAPARTTTTRTTTAARTRAAAAADPQHEVTVALVVPPGGTRDGTVPAALAAAVDGPVSDFWSQATAGAVSFSVTKNAGWMSTTASCTDPFALWGEVARRTGFVEGPGRHLVVYVTPQGTGACAYGLGTIGSGTASGGVLFVRGSLASVVAHELGHNLGLAHSNGLQCASATDAVWDAGWSRQCRRADYRDWYDVMGISWDRIGSLSTAQAFALGVLPATALRTATGPRRTTLHAVSGTTGARSLRVRDPEGPVYVVEYRPAVGRDAWLDDNWPGLRPGVLVRRTDPTAAGQTLLLDGSPSAPARWDADLDAPLGAGDEVSTASGRVRIRVVSTAATTAVVEVAFDGVWPDPPPGRQGRPDAPTQPADPTDPATDDGRVGR